MKIYIIKSTFVEKEKGFTKDNVWSNIYAVKTKEEATSDCIDLQNVANDFYLGKSYKFVYIYEELDMF